MSASHNSDDEWPGSGAAANATAGSGETSHRPQVTTHDSTHSEQMEWNGVEAGLHTVCLLARASACGCPGCVRHDSSASAKRFVRKQELIRLRTYAPFAHGTRANGLVRSARTDTQLLRRTGPHSKWHTQSLTDASILARAASRSGELSSIPQTCSCPQGNRTTGCGLARPQGPRETAWALRHPWLLARAACEAHAMGLVISQTVCTRHITVQVDWCFFC
jgi:hypothetical protein